MLQKVGLLPKGNEESIPLAYSLYKRAMDVPMGLSSRSAARAFKQKFCRKVDVHFIGVFVSAGDAEWVSAVQHGHGTYAFPFPPGGRTPFALSAL